MVTNFFLNSDIIRSWLCNFIITYSYVCYYIVSLYIYIYIYIHTHTHIHTHIYKYIYIYIAKEREIYDEWYYGDSLFKTWSYITLYLYD